MYKWIVLVNSPSNKIQDQTHFIVGSKIKNKQLIYKSIANWLIFDEPNILLGKLWEYIDKDDKNIEEGILYQIQKDIDKNDLITSIETNEYLLDILCNRLINNTKLIKFEIIFSLHLKLKSLKNDLMIENTRIEFMLIRIDNLNDIIDS